MSKDQLKVKNWEQFQHYRDRNPPWIKLHFALLASEDWVTLDDASKLLAVVCMLIASRNNGMVPNNPAYLKRVAYLDKLPKLKPLIDCGFLQIAHADASVLQADASALQADARPETETDTEDKDSSSSQPPAAKGNEAVSRRKALEAEFNDTFWPAYPRKVEKKDALKAFQKARTAASLETIMDGLRAFAAEVAGKEPQFIRHAAKFLNGESWNNATEATTSSVVVDREQWAKRLRHARAQQLWATKDWGPAPGLPGCKAPADLLQPNDGAGWREWERAA
ncbi:hypothetical protein ASF70_18820 [Rhizobium sp. Leaf321]|uniref:hypothetical protein n=1 Tax=Rhizobium sp. Leaf321 TaxID=1736335 RepID=UPI0007146BB0|nr:hypothetical protein [Rhizobium sp. Leaf321]KQQ70902.1 hypothetical protein ASF70_18820 [Rhizobium sp. Leaf321]